MSMISEQKQQVPRPGNRSGSLQDRLRKCPIEKVFLAVFIAIEIIAMTVIPFNAPPDEGTHFLKIWILSTGQMDAEEYEYPENILSRFRIGNQEYSEPEEDLPGLFAERVSSVLVRENSYEVTEVYPFLSYMPQALTVFLARLLTDRLGILFYSARIGSMIVTTLLFYFAVKRIPCGKYLLMAIAFLPMTIQETASASCDGMTIAGISLIIATITGFITGNMELTKHRIIELGVLAFCAVLWKVFYLPVLLLSLLIPADTIMRKRYKYKAGITVILALGFGLLVWYLFSLKTIMITGSRTSSAIPRGLEMISDPLQFISIQANTIRNHAREWFLEVFGVLGRLNRYSPSWLYIPLMMAFLAILCLDEKMDTVCPNKRILICFILMTVMVFLIIWTLLAGCLLVWWTEEGLSTIKGIQGRYFLPIVICVLLCLPSITVLKKTKREKLLQMLITVFSLLSIATLLVLF